MNLKHYTGPEIREHRKKLGVNQQEFWSALSVTQSGGSRYESGRDIPDPVQVLLNIALGNEANSSVIVASLRELAKPHKKATATSKTTPRGFGILP